MVTKTSAGAGWQRAVITLTGTVVGVVVIATLYWAQSVFIPVALAAFLTFLLSPFVTWFRQRGLPRTPAVILVVLCAATALGGVGWLVTEQISSLLRELPKYRHNIQDKVQSFKQATGNLNEIQKIVSEINQEPGKRPGEGQGRERGGGRGRRCSECPRGRRRRRGGPERPGRRGLGPVLPAQSDRRHRGAARRRPGCPG